jgi:hypothetical protein
MSKYKALKHRMNAKFVTKNSPILNVWQNTSEEYTKTKAMAAMSALWRFKDKTTCSGINALTATSSQAIEV